MRARIHGSLLVLALLSVSASTVFAFVPSCEEELAQAYPPTAVADLGVCENPSADVIANVETDLAKFSTRLNGTWKLRSRTLQGLPVGTNSHYARLYFDVDQVDNKLIEGRALLIDHAVVGETVPASSPVAAVWTMRAELRDDGYVTFKMSADSVGDYATATALGDEEHSFFQDAEVFVSVLEESVSSNSWDRMVLMEESLTYVSCERGTVERFVKLSSDEPTVDGVALEEYLDQIDNNEPRPRTVASLENTRTSTSQDYSSSEQRGDR